MATLKLWRICIKNLELFTDCWTKKFKVCANCWAISSAYNGNRNRFFRFVQQNMVQILPATGVDTSSRRRSTNSNMDGCAKGLFCETALLLRAKFGRRSPAATQLLALLPHRSPKLHSSGGIRRSSRRHSGQHSETGSLIQIGTEWIAFRTKTR